MTSLSDLPAELASLCEQLVSESTHKAELVRRVQNGEVAAMADLFEYLSVGLRPYLARQLPEQDCNDKVHNIFVDVVIAIQRGQLRDPQRLMGFARTIARRKVAGYIGAIAADRRNHVDIEAAFWLASPHATPELQMISREKTELVQRLLVHLPPREAEILTRFYMQEQSQAKICSEMSLTRTQFRLLKWRSKARFEQVSKKQTASGRLRALSVNATC